MLQPPRKMARMPMTMMTMTTSSIWLDH